jgi:hypothetical protein
MKAQMRVMTGVLLGLALAGTAGAADLVIVAPDLWDRPRSGAAVAAQPAVQQAVQAYFAQPAARLVIHHAPGQEPLAQADELRAWLVALAIDAGRVTVRGDLNAGEPLKIETAP